MKKRTATRRGLVTLAVAGAFIAPAAMAEVTLSGAINIGLQFGKSDTDTAGNPGLTTQQLHPSYSNINISSSDEIGNGNRVIFNYQMDISGTSSANPTNAGGAIGNRNSYLGIAGNWGAVKVGTNENVYERWQYTSDPLDGAVGPGGNLNILSTPGAMTVFEVGQGGCVSLTGVGGVQAAGSGCVGFYRRAEQQIWYESPNWNGFSFEVDYTLSAFKSTAGTDPQIISVGGKYAPDGMPFYVDAAYERHEDMFGFNKIAGVAGGTSSTDDAVQVGGGYTFGPATLHVRFESLSYETDSVGTWERDAWWLAVKWNVPTGYVGAELGLADEADCSGTGVVCTDTGATMLGVGYFHNLSKQSQLQFIYGRTDNDDNATYAQIGAAGGVGLAGPGRTHQVFDIRIKHVF
ncbi:MAG TPA: porin [Burkholderiales bacterium]|nr:porin [Burkholderiales bacterium]